MRVELRNPSRVIEFDTSMSVVALLNRLGVDRNSVLVIVDKQLVPIDSRIEADAVVEIRSVISGGT